MQRSATLLLSLILVVTLASCGGGNGNSVTTPSSVTLSPSTVSMNFGDWQTLTTKFVNSAGQPVFPDSVTYTSDNTNLVTVTNKGSICAGKWDSLTDPKACTPGTSSGKATITVAAGSVTTTATVYVHAKVNTIEITGSIDLPNCISIAATDAAKTASFQAKAYDSNGVLIPSDNIGPFTWSTGTSTVATVANDTSDVSKATVTAVAPGQTTVNAAVAGIQSTPAQFTACPVKSISLHMPDAPDTKTVTLAAAETKALKADVLDSKGNSITAAIQYNTSQPAAATIGTSGTVTAVAAGTATMVASCTPPACNIGMTPVYSNVFTTTVTGTSSTTVYVASKSDTKLIPIDTATNTAGTEIKLTQKPNSMVFTPNGSKIYIGTDTGNPMVYDVANNKVSDFWTRPGRILGVAPDNNTVVIAEVGSDTVYVAMLGIPNTTQYSLHGASHVSFSPDFAVSSTTATGKLYISGSGGAVEYSARTNSFNRLYSSAVNDVSVLPQGSLVYLAGGTSNVTVHTTCDGSYLTGIAATTGATPALIGSLPNATRVLAVDTSSIQNIGVTVSAPDSGICPPKVAHTGPTPHTWTGVSTFTPTNLIFTPDSAKAYVTSTTLRSVLAYDVATGATSIISLGDPTGITTGGTTLDSKFLYVGGVGTKKVYRIDITSGLLATQIPVELSEADFVVVRPK